MQQYALFVGGNTVNLDIEYILQLTSDLTQHSSKVCQFCTLVHLMNSLYDTVSLMISPLQLKTDISDICGWHSLIATQKTTSPLQCPQVSHNRQLAALVVSKAMYFGRGHTAPIYQTIWNSSDSCSHQHHGLNYYVPLNLLTGSFLGC